HSTCLLFAVTDAAAPKIYALSLHDALPISKLAKTRREKGFRCFFASNEEFRQEIKAGRLPIYKNPFKPKRADDGSIIEWVGIPRSEEHTSELQSRENLVCRLLLEKKKPNR